MKDLKWHYRYLKLAEEVASWSKDPSTKCGCVIISEDNIPISFGYNGFPRGMLDAPERYLDREFKYRHIIHSEENAILSSNRDLRGCYVYITHPPCVKCIGMLRQKGVFSIIACIPDEDFASRWSSVACRELIKELGMSLLLLPKDSTVLAIPILYSTNNSIAL